MPRIPTTDAPSHQNDPVITSPSEEDLVASFPYGRDFEPPIMKFGRRPKAAPQPTDAWAFLSAHIRRNSGKDTLFPFPAPPTPTAEPPSSPNDVE